MNTRVITTREDLDPLSSAWMKELRNYNKTKMVYDVDPFAEVYRFRENVYGILTESADGMGAPWIYLIIGPQKAMLIDTGFGIGNLKGLVDELTHGMPLIVVNTHAHFDHAYGNFQFDQVYCHEYTAAYLRMLDSSIWDYLFDENGNAKWLDFKRDDIITFKNYEIIPCPSGYTFVLGSGYEIELIVLNGHQAGHSAFLDKKNRLLFCGDDFISMRVNVSGPKQPDMPYAQYASVTAFRDELMKLVKRTDEFDTLFPGHFIVDLDNSVVQNMLDVCNEIIAAPNNCDYTDTLNGRTTRFKFVKGLGVVSYRDSSV